MPTDLRQLEDRLRAAYADAAATVRPEDVSERAPAGTSQVRWRAAARTKSHRTTALAAAAAVLLIVITATAIPQVLQSGSRHRSGSPAAAHLPHSHMAYVMGGAPRDLLIPVNLATSAALKPIHLGLRGGESGIAISPDGSLVYVLTVRGQLVPVDVRTGTAGQPIKVGGVSQKLVTTPNGRAAYVLEPPYGVEAVDLAARTALGFIKVRGADGFALTPNGKTLYVLGTNASTTISTTDLVLTAIDTATNATVGTLTLTGPDLRPHLRGWHVMEESVTMAPDGKTVYVSYMSFSASTPLRTDASIIPVKVASDTELKPINVSRSGIQNFTISPDSQGGYVSGAQSVTPIDLRAGTALPPIPLPKSQQSYALTFSPDGGTVYAVDESGPAVVPVDTATNTAQKPIRLAGWPRWNQDSSVFSPDGKTLYVLSYANDMTTAARMTPIDAATGAVGKPIDIPAGLDGIVFSP